VSQVLTADAAHGYIQTTAVAEEVHYEGDISTEKIVRSYFRDVPIMIEIARCESTFRHELADGSVLRGVVDQADTGVMQINKRYHEATAASLGLDLEDVYHNMAYARYLYETQGVQPWNASRPCWGATLAYNR
jgi:hypothetical protein